MHRKIIYLDESGDAGTSKGVRHFIVSAFVISSKKKCHNLLKEQMTNFKNEFGFSFRKEVKFHNLKIDQATYFLNGLRNIDTISYVAHLDTFDVNNETNSLDSNEKKLKIVSQLLNMSLYTHQNISDVILDKGLLDKKKTIDLKEELKQRLVSLPKIKSKKSNNYVGLAYADLIANSVRLRYSKKLSENPFCTVIKDKIKLMEV